MKHLLFLLVVNVVLAWLVMERTAWAQEDSHIENAQLVILALSCVYFLSNTYRYDLPLISLFSALLVFSFILREFDFDKHNFPDLIVLLTAGTGRTVLLIVLFMIYFVFLFRQFSFYRKHAARLLRSDYFYYIVLSAPFFVSSFLLDRQIVVLEHKTFFEEISELNAYYLILIAAIHYQDAFKTPPLPAQNA